MLTLCLVLIGTQPGLRLESKAVLAHRTPQVIEGVRKPDEAAYSASSIRYLPFDVPEGVASISIEVSHEQGAEPGVVELGLFDPRGYGPGGPGFRGWQGSDARPLVVNAEPGSSSARMLAGPIQPGKWHLAQWYRKASPDGLKYKYIVNLGPAGGRTSRFPEIPSYSQSVSGTGERWYAGHLHAYSVHSGGNLSLADLTTASAAGGFDFSVATDQNTWRHHLGLAHAARAAPKHLALVGSELASPFGHGTMLGTRPGSWFDFRFEEGSAGLKQIIKDVHKQGGLFVINHPFSATATGLWQFGEEEWQEADGIQVWHGAWDAEDDQALAMWQESLSAPKKRLALLGGTGFRREGDPLMPAVWVKAGSLSRDALLRGIREGRVVLTATPKMVPPELTVGDKEIGETIKATVMRDPSLPKGIKIYAPVELVARVRGFKGHALHVRSAWGDVGFAQGTLIDSDDFNYTQVVRPGGDGFYRLEVRSGDAANWGSVLALTTPVFAKK